MYIGSRVKYPPFFSDFNKTWIFSIDFRKILKYQNFMKILPVGTDYFLADERTDRQPAMTKLIVAFRNFENAPKTSNKLIIHNSTILC
jgi:hypothetical protein